MRREQEPKYCAVTRLDDASPASHLECHLINRMTGEPIPDDEPVFVFRARDKFAAAAIANYHVHLTFSGEANKEHLEAVKARVDDFRRFAAEHPDRMKTPDTGSRP